ncbi:MAG TPA: hypothetical protein PK445_09630 [Methanolinea sp.]|jgi:hypothetical protein|nr:hypothetical protein [Methanolinea sp.]
MALDIRELQRIRHNMSSNRKQQVAYTRQDDDEEPIRNERRLLKQAVDEFDNDDYLGDDELIIDDDIDYQPPVRNRPAKQKTGMFRKHTPTGPERRYDPPARTGRPRDWVDGILFILILGSTALVVGISAWQALTGKTSTDYAYSIRYIHIAMAALTVNIMMVYLSLRLALKNTM